MKYARLFPNASSSTRLISNDHGFCQYPNIPIMRNFHTQSTTTNLPAGSDHKNVLQVIATHCASTVAPSFLVSDEAAAGFASFCYGAISDGKSGTGMGACVSIYWNYETLNYGCGIMAGGEPAPLARGIGCGGGDRYLLGLKPPMAAISAMFVIWIIVFCWPNEFTYWFGEYGEKLLLP